jgi:hypothetical protein
VNEPTNSGEPADRYRRLLAWYPRDHRERHGEEMLGVLLAGAGERTRPSRRETMDLLRGALRLRLRRAVGADGGIDHRDVLAIVSLLGPIVLLAGAAPLLNTVAVLSLCQMRRTAAVGAWLGTLAFLPTAALGYTPYWNTLILSTGWLLLGGVVAVALTWSPGPARGWELVGGRRIVLLAAAVGTSVMLVMKTLDTYDVLFFPIGHLTVFQGAGRVAVWFLALAVLVAGAVVGGGTRTREGRRAALVLCVPVVVSVLMLVLPRNSDVLVVAAVCYGVPVAMLLGLGGLPRRVRGTN